MKIHPMTGEQPTGFDDWPVREGGSTGRVGSFGMTRDGGQKRHKGTDYICKLGHPICATMDGTVGRCGESVPRDGIQDGRKGYGYRCYIRHSVTTLGQKLETRYAHLGVLFVKEGQKVRAGEIIGQAGRSGNVDRDVETHLHYEVRINNNATDPVVWLR